MAPALRPRSKHTDLNQQPGRPSVRFAPSPTGTFHVGNLRTAWISHELARALSMEWVVRFEDIDRPRVVAGAQDRQLADMQTLGLEPDRVLLQSDRAARHEDLFRRAVDCGVVYPCACSRKEIQEELRSLASAPHGSTPVYSGRCREPSRRPEAVHPTLAWRFRHPREPSGTLDFLIGRTAADGTDFQPGYHWACAIDDYDGDHALLVRAVDLAQAEPLQRLIHAWAGETERSPRAYPAIFHTALVTDNSGHRLEKRTRGVTLDELRELGISPELLVERFRRSFDAQAIAGYAPGRVWEESPAELRLAELLY